jgi:hypothetical protein
MPVGVPSSGGVGGNGPSTILTINKWGEQIDVDTADAALGQVIWPVKATTQQYLFLDSPVQLFAKSSSANDTLLGSGARQIAVKNWHGSDGNFASEAILDMNGVNNVALPQTSYGVFSFEVESSGATGNNEGNIDIVDGSGNIYARMVIGEGRTQIAAQRISNNLKGNIRYHKVDYARSSGNNNATMRLRRRKADGTITTIWDPTLTSVNTDDEKEYFVGGISVEPGEWIYWECTSTSADNTPIRGSFDIELENI